MARRGFTTVETLLTLGIIAVTAGVTVPLYRNYQIRSDLDIAVEYTVQGLHRAQVLSQTGQQGAVWGFSVREGVLFQGEAYAVREVSLDEVYPQPPSVTVSGLMEVTFQRVSGIPNQTGDIILEALNGERRIITVSSDGLLTLSDILPPLEVPGSSAGTSEPGSTGSTGSASSEGGMSSGASASSVTSGGGASSSAGAGTSSQSSQAGDGTGGDNGGGTGGSSSTASDGSSVSSEPTCEDVVTVQNNGTIETTGTVNATIKVLGVGVSEATGGSNVRVRLSASTDNGRTWVALFGGAALLGGEETTLNNLPAGTKILLKVNGRHSWLFNRTFVSNGAGGHMLSLRKGDALPDFDIFKTFAALPSVMRSLINAQGRVEIGEHDVLSLTELDTLWKSAADFQDVVTRVSFASPAGSCAASADPKFKVIFDRLENTGNGDGAQAVYTGPQAEVFADGQWIPLKVSGVEVTDSGLTEAVPGLSVQRQSGIVKVLLHGSHAEGSGKEIVDARIVFEHALVESVVNDGGQNATENPFDGIVNDGAGGDEVTVSADKTSVLFQARVTAADDAILIHWVKGEPAAGQSSSGAGSSASGASEGSQSSAGSTGSAEGGESSDGIASDACAAAYTLDSQGRMVLSEKADITFSVLGTHVTYGDNGPAVRVRFNVSLDGGKTWRSLFRFRDIVSGDGETFTDVPAGSVISLSAEGRYSWLFKQVAKLGESDNRLRLLRPGQAVPAIGLLKTPSKLQKFLRDRLQDGKVHLGRRYLLLLTELQDMNGSEDFQDAAVLIAMEKPASEGVCAAQDYGSSASSAQSSGVGNASSVSSAAGSLITICHFPQGNAKNPQTMEIPESAWSGHGGHGDRPGACESDEDGDGVPNSRDLCAGTYSPEPVPTEMMLFDRYALTSAGSTFRVGPRKKISSYALADTRGCSCEQLVDVAESVRDYHFIQFPSLHRQMRSLFPFYTSGARQYGCGKAILNMVKP